MTDRPAGPEVRWVEVASFSREEEARLLAGRLEAEGIEVQVFPEFQASYYRDVLRVPVRVLVPEHRVAEAHQIVERLRS
jgi:Putative prokaryotic signal transducing protein